MRKTKIVATLGPACQDLKVLTSLIQEGADVLRINASHTTPQGIREWIHLARRAARLAEKKVAILVDLQGPRVRTGRLSAPNPLPLKRGAEILIATGNGPGREGVITTSCRQFPRMVKQGDRVLIDNGTLELRVTRVSTKGVACRVLAGGNLGENKGINLPNAPITLPVLTDKDREALKIAASEKIDYIALSFVRRVDDVFVVKKWLKRFNSDLPVIAKIEKPRAVGHLNSILQGSQGVMVARGDLGIELGVEKVPALQKKIIARANKEGVPVITATQMLESMMENPRPTRAEASDIANAVFDGTDAVMLSGETAVGKYPLKAVRMMKRIVCEAEGHLKEPLAKISLPESRFRRPVSALVAMTQAASSAAEALQAKAIVVFTRSGKTALAMSKMKPACPIFAFTSPATQTRLALYRGVMPLVIPFSESTDQMIWQADRLLLQNRLLKQGDTVILVTGRLALPGARYLNKCHQVGEASRIF